MIKHKAIAGGLALTLALIGLLGVTANQMLFLFGLHLSTPLHAALLYAFTPVIVLGGAVIWLGERFSGLKVGGIALAVIGVVLVLTARGLDLTDLHLKQIAKMRDCLSEKEFQRLYEEHITQPMLSRFRNRISGDG